MWFVYIIQCQDETLYTGITTDIQRRIEEHNSSEKGAKYTKGKQPVLLVYHKQCIDRSAAAKEEYRIKQLSRKEKQKLIRRSV